MIEKKIGAILLTMVIGGVSLTQTYAAQPAFSIYPPSGTVRVVEEGFTIDVLLDSGGYDVSKARFVIKYDPTILRLKKAFRNNTLFEQWLDSESSTDNTDGIVMLTGATPSNEITPFYKTEGTPDIMARLEFDVVTSDINDLAIFEFEYSGLDEPFKSVILKSGTPSINILDTQPSSAVFSLNIADIPQTAIGMDSIGIIVGIILLLVGVFIRSGSVKPFYFKRGTIVLEE